MTYGNWETTPKPADANLNTGVYKAYYNQQFEEKETDGSLLSQLNNTSLYRFYVLNITWGQQGTDNMKETDIVYIVTKGTD